MASRDFRIAVIGAGAIGRSHVERVLATQGFQLVGVAEPRESGRAWCAGRGVDTYASHRELLDATRPDGAIVATPNQTHLEVSAECIGLGVPVLLEKPLADTVEAAGRLVDLRRTSGVPVLVGHHRRHNPILQRARELVRDGRLGRIVAAHAMATFYKPSPYFDVSWRRQPGGGPVMINLIHDVDMLVFLLGPAIAAQGRSSHAVRGLPVEDTACAILEFAAGTLATLVASDTAASPWNWDLCAGEQPQYPRQPVQTHFLCGTEGSLSLPDLALWTYRGERSWHAELSCERTPVHAADPYLRQLLHFRAVARGEDPPACSALDAFHSLQATAALLEAAREGRRITWTAHPGGTA
jgi:predicted dehydrogenase